MAVFATNTTNTGSTSTGKSNKTKHFDAHSSVSADNSDNIDPDSVILSNRTIFLVVALRLFNALLLSTSFVPDEYWQGPEVAHRWVFGYGHLTWEWRVGLRGVTHPGIFAALYAILRVLHLDSSWAIARGPMLLQSLFLAAGDIYTARLASAWFTNYSGSGGGGGGGNSLGNLSSTGKSSAGEGGGTGMLATRVAVVRWTLICSLFSWFNAYCGPRTLSNSMEAALTPVALYYLPRTLSTTTTVTSSTIATSVAPRQQRRQQQQQQQQQQPFNTKRATIGLIIAGVTVLLRPNAAATWLAVVGCLLASGSWLQRARFVGVATACAVTVLSVSLVADRTFYGQWTVVQWEFLRFNLLSGASAHYGTHPWHWYITQGLPTVLGPLTPLAVAGAWQSMIRLRMPYYGISAAKSSSSSSSSSGSSSSCHFTKAGHGGSGGGGSDSGGTGAGAGDSDAQQQQHQQQHQHQQQQQQQQCEYPPMTKAVVVVPNIRAQIVTRARSRMRAREVKAAEVEDAPTATRTHPICGVLDRTAVTTTARPDAAAYTAQRTALVTIAFVTAVFSLSDHKEFRFVYSLLFLFMPFCGAAAAKLWAQGDQWQRVFVITMLALNVPLAGYTGLVHQRGALDVMGVLRREIASAQDDAGAGAEVGGILFLTQCHATPFYSHIHVNISAAFLECPPPGYGRDEAAVFFDNPAAWLEREATLPSSLLQKGDEKLTTKTGLMGVGPSSVVNFSPSLVVLPEDTAAQPGVARWLEGNALVQVERVFHSHVIESERTGTHFVVYSKRRPAASGPAL
eukprot:UC1_evm7s2112